MRQNYRTKSKKKILEFFQKNHGRAIGAAEVYQALNDSEEGINLATVYRNLEKMTESGSLIKLQNSQSERAVYQYVEEHEHCREHIHLQCVKCGEVIHLECGFMEKITVHLADHHKFELQCTNSILYGVCNQCRTNYKEKEGYQ